MVTLLCFCCDHRNPAGAKFCNACGTPLHLKPCPRCEAINERAAAHCHQCGEAFGFEFLTRADGPVLADESNAAAAAARVDADGDAGRSQRSRKGFIPTLVGALLLGLAGAALIAANFAYRDDRGWALDAAGAAERSPVAVVSPAEPPDAAYEQATAPPIDVERVTPPQPDERGHAARSGFGSRPTRPDVGTKSRSAATRPAIRRNHDVPDATPTVVRSPAEPARGAQVERTTAALEARKSAPSGSFAVNPAADKQRPRDGGRRFPSTAPPWDRPCAEGVALESLCDVRMMAKGN